MKKYILSGLMAAAIAAPSFAYAASPAPAGQNHSATSEQGSYHPNGWHCQGHHSGSWHGQRHDSPQRHMMRLSERLAAMETALGIRSNQLDSWRKYSSAYVDMVRMTPPNPGQKIPDQTKPQAIPGERFADRAVERAEKTKAFKQAAADLRKVLDEKQLERLAAFNKPPHGGKMAPAPAPEPETGDE